MAKIASLQNKATIDLSDKYGLAVKFDVDGVNVVSAATDRAVGVITTGAAAGGISGVCVHGDCKAFAGGTIVAGQHITPGADGRVIATGAGSQDLGIALEGGVAGDLIGIYVIGAVKTNA